MQNLRNAEHPLWPTIRYCVGIFGATIILYVNASDFDMTEIKSLGLLALIWVGWEPTERYLRHLMPTPKDPSA